MSTPTEQSSSSPTESIIEDEKAPRINWTIEEDKQLVISYLKISEDGEIGTGQKSGTLWQRIKANFDLHDGSKEVD
jgi:hypothetical protein